MILAQGMTDAFFLFLQLVAILQRALGCLPQEDPVMIIERHKTYILMFSAILQHGMEVGMHTAPAP